MNALKFGILLALALPGFVHAEQVAQAASPDGRIVVQLDLNGEGRLAYRVLRNGKPVIADSRLGFLPAQRRASCSATSTCRARTPRSLDDTWEQPWGERRFVRNHYNELRVELRREATRDKRRFDVVFRVFDDGVGFRYEFPKQPNLGEAQHRPGADRVRRRRAPRPPGGSRPANGTATSTSTTARR